MRLSLWRRGQDEVWHLEQVRSCGGLGMRVRDCLEVCMNKARP